MSSGVRAETDAYGPPSDEFADNPFRPVVDLTASFSGSNRQFRSLSFNGMPVVVMTAKRNTADGDHLDVLVTLVEAWESKHYPIDLPDPIAAIRYHMEQNGLAAKDLVL